jgi:hypothetical protein
MNEEDEAFNELERRLDALRDHPEYYKPIAKHAMPSQREWVGLTHKEIGDELYKFEAAYEWYQFAQAIEAKLKEKNT